MFIECQKNSTYPDLIILEWETKGGILCNQDFRLITVGV